jgi:RNA polymerase subunit RPABC4/transcription elongation factor Spt4
MTFIEIIKGEIDAMSKDMCESAHDHYIAAGRLCPGCGGDDFTEEFKKLLTSRDESNS